MIIKDIMTKDVAGLIPESLVKEAAHKMRSLGIGFLPVCDGERLIGVLTDRDIILRATARGKDPDKTMVEEIMTKGVKWIFGDQTIEEAVEKMSKYKIRRLPVINHEKELVGVVTLGDIAVYADASSAAEALKSISMPAQPLGRT